MTDDLRRPMRRDDMTTDDLDRTADTGLPQADEMRRTDDLAPTGQDAPAGAPAGRPDWNAHEWEGENQPRRDRLDDTSSAAMNDTITGEPKWNEHEFVGEGQGGPNEGPDERVIPTEGDNEFSGHGHNPGGGERWADVDRGLPDDPTGKDARRKLDR